MMSLVTTPVTASAGGGGPHHQQQPGRDQQHGAVEAVGGQIDHQRQPEHRDAGKRHARDAGGDRRIEHRDRDQRGERGEPGDGDVGVAHVPARQIEIGEQEYQQRRRQDRLAAGAPDALGAGRHVEHLAPEAEVDADVDEHRPAERGGGRKHHRALHHEQNGEEQRQQAGDADDDAVVEREGVDLVLVGVRLPQIDLRQLVGAQFGDEGDDGAGIERDAEDVRGRVLLPHRPVARRRRDGDDARQSEIGPEQAGADHAVMRHDDQPVDLLVGIIGEREHRPVGVGFARAHFDAAHDAVGAGRGGDLDAVGFGLLHVGRGGEIDGRDVEPHVDRFERARAAAPPATRRRARTPLRSACKLNPNPPAAARASHDVDCGSAGGEICKPIPQARLCCDIAPISRLRTACGEYRLRWPRAIDRKCFQRVSTILPIWALLSISAWAAAASREREGLVDHRLHLAGGDQRQHVVLDRRARSRPCRRPSASAASSRCGAAA